MVRGRANLSREECEQILAVIQRDVDIRKKEQDRISKIEEELNEKASQRIVLAKRKEFNEKWCILCCSTFNLLFNRKLQCHDCKFHVCRSCAAWESHEKVWLCRICDHQRSLYIQSCEWFYDHIRQKFKHFGRAKLLDTLHKKKKECPDSENDSGYGPSLDPGGQSSRQVFLSVLTSNLQEDSTSLTESIVEEDCDQPESRQHLENIVEGLLGAGLDSARVDRVYTHPLYEKLFHDYHKILAEKVELLGKALREALANEHGDSSPTSSHAALKNVLQDVTDVVAFLPVMEEKEADDETPRPDDPSTTSDDDFYTNYNDLMAAAIINKVVEMDQQRRFPAQRRNTPSSISGEMNSSCASETLTDGRASPEFTWIPGDKMECIQVEEIKEIHEYQDPSHHDTYSVITRSLPDEDISDLEPLAFWENLDASSGNRIPFPELGRDLLLDPEEAATDWDTWTLEVENWEDNWLFRKKKRAATYGGISKYLLSYYFDPPCMLIPRPLEDSQVLVGDIDVDQLSDLSEVNSVGSIEFSTSECDTDQEMEEYGLSKEQMQVDSPYAPKNRPRIKIETEIQLSTTIPPQEEPQRPVPKPRSRTPPEDGLPVPVFITSEKRPSSSPNPKFLEVPKDVTLHAGKMVHFQCQVAGTMPLGVAWFHGPNRIEEGGKYVLSNPHQGSYRLEIYDTGSADNGTYSCLVYSRLGQNWVDFNLKIRATTRSQLPPEFVMAPKEVSEGKVLCTISGYPDPQILVYRTDSNTLLSNSSKYSMEHLGYGEWELEIHHFEPRDSGEYCFVARNSQGHVKSCLNLTCSKGGNDSAVPPVQEEATMRMEESRTEEVCDDSEEIHQPMYSTSEIITINTKQGDRPNVIQRTWPERVAQMKRPKCPEITEKVEPPPMVVEEIPKTKTSQFPINAPPRPGTIAEREHRKWQMAPPISNNPYSADNLSRRQRQRQWGGHILTYEEYNQLCGGGTDLSGTDDGETDMPGRLDRYQRDYYVNLPRPEMPGPEETLNSLEEKVYIRAGKVVTANNGVKRLEREVHSEEFLRSDSTDFSLVESEKEERPVIWSSTPQKATTLAVKPVTLPCVKRLASKFAGLTENGAQDSRTAASNGHTPSRPPVKVHSLTARSLSREFRETALRNLPRPMNRTVSRASESGADSSAPGGYTSDESTTSTASLPMKVRKKSPSILQRASYWEKRAEQGLLSDTSVNEEFPPMEF